MKLSPTMRCYWGRTAALFVVLLAMSVVALFASGNLRPGVREDRGNRWVIAAFAVIGLVDGYLPALSDRKEFWTIDRETVRWMGVVLFAIGGALRRWAVFVLGQRFSGLVAIQPGHALVTSGIYRFIRHPSYLGLLITAFGWGLAFARELDCCSGAARTAACRTHEFRRTIVPVRIWPRL